jgi:hypothetical protein
MELGDVSEEKLEQLMTVAEQRGMTRGKDIQMRWRSFFARKAVGESLLAYLNNEASRCGEATFRSTINFWANHIRHVKDLRGVST